MRVAIISTCALPTPPPAYGGTELMVAELAKGLVALGHEVSVYATADSTASGTLRPTLPRPVWPPAMQAERRHAALAWRDIAAAAASPDVVHLHHAASLPYSRSSAIPTVLTIHHMRDEQLLRRYRASPHVSYVAISHRQAALCPELQIARTVHHGLDPARYPKGDGQGGYLAFLGRLAPEKAPHVAIDAARRAKIPLRIGGAAHETCLEYYKREVRWRLSGPGVQSCGELGHAAKLELLRGARALLMPLHWEEPFGLVMIEAMLVGTPVIAYARGSAPEIVEEGLTGFVVRGEDEMVARIGQLAHLDRDRCRARAEARWSHLRMAREYAELYRQLRPRQSASPRFLATARGGLRAHGAWAPPARTAESLASARARR